MKKTLVLIIAIGFLSSSFSFYDSLGFSRKELPSADIAIDRVLEKTLTKLREKQQLFMIGLGGSQKDHKENLIDISLALNKILTKEECRRLIVECAELYLNDINSDGELKKYLYQHPFTHKNLDISIFLRKPDGGDINYPDIRVISLYGSKIFYRIQDPNFKYKYITTQESYEEALRIIRDKNE